MKRILPLTFILFAIGTFFALAQEPVSTDPSPTANQVIQGQWSTVNVYFNSLKQGRVGVIQVVGELQELDGTFLDNPLTFFQVPMHEGYFALLVVPLSQTIRDYDLTIAVVTPNGAETLTTTLSVETGGFVRQDVIVVGDANGLLNHDIEDAELAHLFELAKPSTPTVYWQATGFGHPVDSELTSPFGAVRAFNGLYETLHTGWDYQAPTGKPLVASSAGKVVFAGHMDIRGNYVMLDHGYGIYSGYAHLSVIFVTQGETVSSGQILGLVGTTGRSSSAHAHFEMIVNNQWIDTRDFIGMYLPK